MLGEGMSELRVDQLGQCRPVGFVADVPACSRQLGVGRRGTIPPSWSGPLIAGEDRGQQQVFVLGQVA
jgi:hypothetical protein